LTVIRAVSVIVAFLRLLAFYRRSKVELKQHGVVSKLVAIKGIVFLTFLQTVSHRSHFSRRALLKQTPQIVFTILNSTSAVSPSAKLSYNDIFYGIPSVLICGEMVFFALFHVYAYSAKPYFLTSSISSAESQAKPSSLRYHGGFLGIKASAAALNPSEIISGLIEMLRYVVTNPRVQ